MTGLLVSVRSVAEARLALEAGADVIDVKEPARGSLGAADIATVAAVAEAMEHRRPVSAACGELCELAASDAWLPGPGAMQGSAAPLDYAKVGLSGLVDHGDRAERWGQWIGRLPAGIRAVAVSYADAAAARAPAAEWVIDEGTRLGCQMWLIDTWQKHSGDLFDQISTQRLASLMARARAAGLGVALAGSLAGESLSRAIELEPDLVAVRGAACEGGRGGPLCPQRVAQLARQVRADWVVEHSRH